MTYYLVKHRDKFTFTLLLPEEIHCSVSPCFS